MKILLVLLPIAIQLTIAYRRCRPPEAFYGKYVNIDGIENCHPGKRGKNDAGIRSRNIAIIHKFCNAPKSMEWIRGTRVNLDKCMSIPKYTPIASFTKRNGRYGPRRSHAGIFIKCINGNIEIADQWCGKARKFNTRTLRKLCIDTNPFGNCAEYFYTIEWNSNSKPFKG